MVSIEKIWQASSCEHCYGECLKCKHHLAAWRGRHHAAIRTVGSLSCVRYTFGCILLTRVSLYFFVGTHRSLIRGQQLFCLPACCVMSLSICPSVATPLDWVCDLAFSRQKKISGWKLLSIYGSSCCVYQTSTRNLLVTCVSACLQPHIASDRLWCRSEMEKYHTSCAWGYLSTICVSDVLPQSHFSSEKRWPCNITFLHQSHSESVFLGVIYVSWPNS